MRVGILIFACVLGLVSCSRSQLHHVSTSLGFLKHAEQTTAPKGSSKVDFATQVKPILEARCQKCHFAGGPMYERLPFDKPETIVKLGTKLFTRLKDESDQRVIREFLAQQSQSTPATP